MKSYLACNCTRPTQTIHTPIVYFQILQQLIIMKQSSCPIPCVVTMLWLTPSGRYWRRPYKARMEVKFKPQTLCNPRKACGRAPHLFLSTLSSDCCCAEWPNFYITFILHLYNTFILRSMEIYFQCLQRKGTSSAQQREPAWKIWRLTRRGWYVKDCSIYYQTCHPFPKPPIRAHRTFWQQ